MYEKGLSQTSTQILVRSWGFSQFVVTGVYYRLRRIVLHKFCSSGRAKSKTIVRLIFKRSEKTVDPKLFKSCIDHYFGTSANYYVLLYLAHFQ